MQVPINMRVPVRKRRLIDAAAGLLGIDRTSFILDAACDRATEVVLDSRQFNLGKEGFERFERALESNPMSSNECLKQLLAKQPQWS